MAHEFKLEALRKFRQHQEDEKRKKLAQAQRNLEEALDKLSTLLARRERTEEDLQQCQLQSTTGQQITVYLKFLQKLAGDIEQQQATVAGFRHGCELAREEVLEAMKQRKILDKLKEKEWKRYLDNLNHEEEKFIGEMAINRYIHRQG